MGTTIAAAEQTQYTLDTGPEHKLKTKKYMYTKTQNQVPGGAKAAR